MYYYSVWRSGRVILFFFSPPSDLLSRILGEAEKKKKLQINEFSRILFAPKEGEGKKAKKNALQR